VLDTGVPTGHAQLGPYLRGSYRSPTGPERPTHPHGSRVASRVVFGDLDFEEGIEDVDGTCQYLDVQVSEYADMIDDKAVLPAMQAIAGTFPDVRVFNLSFDNLQPLSRLTPVQRREKLIDTRELDNFIFANDVIAVTAAGNTPRGIAPTRPYPDHVDDEQWGLGPWACSFNSMVCGAYVDKVTAGGLVTEIGWPSPFTRVGPGIADSPVPSYSAPGGNTDPNYQFQTGLGVWCLDDQGHWHDAPGTSFAAPLLAREAAFTLQELLQYCESGTKPFSVTAKAFLALTAVTWSLPGRVQALADRTLGMGRASTARLGSPIPGSAVILWQGVIESSSDLIRIQLPIPREWYQTAEAPSLRCVVSYNPPVTDAAHDIWACRRVELKLKPSPEERALRPRKYGASHPTYPLIDRWYDLKALPSGVSISGDLWMLEVSYKELADPPAGIDFDSGQRVAIAAELYDRGEKPVDPQPTMQALDITATMNRLSIGPATIRTPVVLKSRV